MSISLLSSSYVDKAVQTAESATGEGELHKAEVFAMSAVALALLSISEQIHGLRETHAMAHGLVVGR